MTVGNPPPVFANYMDVLTQKDSFVLLPCYLLASILYDFAPQEDPGHCSGKHGTLPG